VAFVNVGVQSVLAALVRSIYDTPKPIVERVTNLIQ
jgi:hypothetical protein